MPPYKLHNILNKLFIKIFSPNKDTTTQVPLPPEVYMRLVCGQHDDLADQFNWAGEVVLNMLDEEGMTADGTSFLDVGCGCGRIARRLMERPISSYTGFDRHPGMIRWCREQIGARDPRFAFHYFSLQSSYQTLDGHKGRQPASAFAFPYPAASFSAVLLASIFTHMPLQESVHYLRELYRVLAPGGKILLSVFLSDDEEDGCSEVDFYYHTGTFLGCLEEIGFKARFRQKLAEHHWYTLSTSEAAPALLLDRDVEQTSG
ncbi:class I SAM-dependent methyltransferase [Desulfatitalea alkaliphila]|uniref:Class I SAM-dependent methyltransferase n=1 Tax=Desulfatitalea alkaliphila TaxID=2929485 RepID=A0AA41QZV4_9BACT|nr:class I SAM-dependent methyltransferase [Desulfatitalea alkaliphila]MCJ8499384.1 class I SAM-dependent methyltransferase [Desulfatitalea alkaliphila]